MPKRPLIYGLTESDLLDTIFEYAPNRGLFETLAKAMAHSGNSENFRDMMEMALAAFAKAAVDPDIDEDLDRAFLFAACIEQSMVWEFG